MIIIIMIIIIIIIIIIILITTIIIINELKTEFMFSIHIASTGPSNEILRKTSKISICDFYNLSYCNESSNPNNQSARR